VGAVYVACHRRATTPIVTAQGRHTDRNERRSSTGRPRATCEAGNSILAGRRSLGDPWDRELGHAPDADPGDPRHPAHPRHESPTRPLAHVSDPQPAIFDVPAFVRALSPTLREPSTPPALARSDRGLVARHRAPPDGITDPGPANPLRTQTNPW
jgi:hypothetical protein